MLTNNFYGYLAWLMASQTSEGSTLFVAVGSGNSEWDNRPPELRREQIAFQQEVSRYAVNSNDIVFITDNGEVSEAATSRIQISATFGLEQALGTIRETGIFAMGATEQLGSGVLLSYFVHPRIDKTTEVTLERKIVIDLEPDSFRALGHLTRYLGNASSEELHDLENEKVNCQISELRIDRRHYFQTIEQAQVLGYDYCAHCFGRELSQR